MVQCSCRPDRILSYCCVSVCLVMKPFHHSFYLVESIFCFHRKMTHCSPGSFSGHCNPGFDGGVKETRVRSGRSSWDGSRLAPSEVLRRTHRSCHCVFCEHFLTCTKVSNGVVCVVVTQVVSNIFQQGPSNALRACFFNYLFSGFLHLRPIGVTH